MSPQRRNGMKDRRLARQPENDVRGRIRSARNVDPPLPIVTMERHGGTVTAESDGEGQGSTFTVTLPLRAQAEPLPGAVRLAAVPRSA